MKQLLKRSFQLEAEIGRLLDLPAPVDSARESMSKIMCSIAIEHASSAKVLIRAGNKTAAVSLFRLQYEALVRAIWLIHAASQAQIDALSEPINESNFKRINNQQRSLSQMLKDLDAPPPEDPDGQLPKHILLSLQEIKESSWTLLCSMVHGGVLALQTHAVDFPNRSLETLIKHSNGISCLAANLLIIISADSSFAGYTTKLYKSFPDCLPIPEKA